MTYNWEADIGPCLESVADLADEVFIVDSFSTDRTLEIARQYTSNIHLHQFENFAAQRNWALDNLPMRHKWVLHLDADERLTPRLREEIRELLGRDSAGIDGFYIKRRFYFLGRWLRFGANYPMPEVRLFLKHLARVIDAGPREYLAVRGKVGTLRHDMIHENNRGLSAWISKADMMAEWEADELLTGAGKARLASATASEYVELKRSRWLRDVLWHRVPMFVRPFLLFILRYVIQFGFLDGAPGLSYAVLKHFWYPFLISAKYYEKSRARRSDGAGASAQSSPASSPPGAIARNLKRGLSGDDIMLLQKILIKDGVYPEALSTGYFGPLTHVAVIRFQEKYFSEILKPVELNNGNGFVGSYTRKKQ